MVDNIPTLEMDMAFFLWFMLKLELKEHSHFPVYFSILNISIARDCRLEHANEPTQTVSKV